MYQITHNNVVINCNTTFFPIATLNAQFVFCLVPLSIASNSFRAQSLQVLIKSEPVSFLFVFRVWFGSCQRQRQFGATAVRLTSTKAIDVAWPAESCGTDNGISKHRRWTGGMDAEDAAFEYVSLVFCFLKRALLEFSY